MKYIWFAALWAWLCTFSVCFAKSPALSLMEVKIVVKTELNSQKDPHRDDSDLARYVYGQNLRMIHLGYFTLIQDPELNGKSSWIVGRSSLTLNRESPKELKPGWPILSPTLLAEWMNEEEPHPIYIKFQGSQKELEQLQDIASKTPITLIIGDGSHMFFNEEHYGDHVRRKYIIPFDSTNTEIKIPEAKIKSRLKDFFRDCKQYLTKN